MIAASVTSRGEPASRRTTRAAAERWLIEAELVRAVREEDGPAAGAEGSGRGGIEEIRKAVGEGMSAAKYTWGEAAVVRQVAPAEARPGAIVSICGMREVESRAEAVAAGVTPGTVLYIVEFPDGASLEVPETWLQKPPE